MGQEDETLEAAMRLFGYAIAFSLAASALRAGLLVWAGNHLANGVSPQMSESLPIGIILEGLLIISVAVVAVCALAWLYSASLVAHRLKPAMRHSAKGGVIWFLVPVFGTFMSISVLYDLWTASGGSQKGSRIILVWWLLNLPILSPLMLWGTGQTPNLLGQAFLIAPMMAFFVLARRVTRMLETHQVVETFSDEAVDLDEDDDDWAGVHVDPFEPVAHAAPPARPSTLKPPPVVVIARKPS